MKKPLITFFATCLFIFNVAAQPCPWSISFDSQDEVDNFQYNYPGCTEIEASITIYSQIHNLHGLSVLTSVGSLDLYFAENLEDLTGLENLTSIGGDLSAVGTGLHDFSGLENLSYIGSDLWILSNNSLTSLSGLDGLDSIGARLVLTNNDLLTSLDGLGSLISIAAGLFLDDNDGLTSLAGLNSLAWTGNYISITNNNALTNLLGLEAIVSVIYDIKIIDNEMLLDINGLNAIQSVGRDVIINNNPVLGSLGGLENLNTITRNLRIFENESLMDLGGLEQLSVIGETLEIRNNNMLSDISSLSNVNPDILTNLSIFDNPSLSICEIENICEYLAAPNGRIIIHSNDEGCNHVVEIASACDISLPCLPFGDYYFNSQQDIDDFTVYFPGCTELQGNVLISGDDINDLSSLNTVTSIGGSLVLEDNSSLTSLTQLNNLSMLGNVLRIRNNDLLASLEGINNIELGVDNNLWIRDNALLSECNQHNICYFINNYWGLTNFANNATGCSSLIEIAGSCGTLDVNSIKDKNYFDIYPNPFSKQAIISFTLPCPSPVIMQLFDENGQVIRKTTYSLTTGNQKIIIDSEGKAEGIYFLKVTTDNWTITKKLIIMK